MIRELTKFNILPRFGKSKKESLVEAKFKDRAEALAAEVDSKCNNSALGSKLPNYLAEMMTEDENKEFADHFQQCKACLKKVVHHEINIIRSEVEECLFDDDDYDWTWETAGAASAKRESAALAVSIENKLEFENNF